MNNIVKFNESNNEAKNNNIINIEDSDDDDRENILEKFNNRSETNTL